MAQVWFLMTVVIQIVIAFDTDIGNCNECIRNGGNWCNKIQSQHCALSPDDNWCPDDQEKLPSISMKTPGKILNPGYIEKRLYIGVKSRTDISYDSSVELAVSQKIVNSTQTLQNESIELKVYNTACTGTSCTTTLEAMPTTEFCLTTGGVYEYVYVKVTIGDLADKTIIKYLIPCACPCSFKVEKKSSVCHGNGDFACGICSCYNGWSGEFCDKTTSCSTKGGCHSPIKDNNCKYEINSAKCNNKGDFLCGECHCHSGWSGKFCENIICPEKRGDVQCTNPSKNDVECSGNGFCGPCETCVCYTDREGSQYFDEENYCSDLCMLASDCDSCLLNNTIGECQDCHHRMFKLPYNESLVELKDGLNRKIWMRCNETIDDCPVRYYATKNEMEQIQIMIVEHCDNHIALQTSSTKVPIIFGVLGLLATVLAIAGIMAWKHFNTVPPLPLSDPEYQNIDAEDCTGENPLYKSPMSSFKNPTYGKW